ncbi:MAG: alpha-L-fucosidase [Candidatus Sumerlaeota bacterium]|nr:alpha-L-fucosidase [Candidatus Sumerlaeota bacterium]
MSLTLNEVFPGSGKQPRRPANFAPWRYPLSVDELRARDSDDMMRRAAAAWDEIHHANQSGKWKPTDDSLTSHHAPQWFLDAKFGMFLDWGPWAVAGWAAPTPKAMYPDWYEYFCRYKPETAQYHDEVWGKDFHPDNFLPLLTGSNFSAEYYAQLAADAGMKYVVPFNKHHGGYCLWDSSFTHRTSLKIGARRDFTAEIMQACRARDLRCGAYFSLFEWFYPIIAEGGIMLQTDKGGKIIALDEINSGMIAGKIPVRDFVSDYLAPQLKELIDRYDPDLLWYDGDWLDPMTYFRTHELNAYFYNHAEGRKEVAINDRSGRTRAEHGVPRVIADFITSEFHSFDGTAGFPWEECRSISQSYGYNWEDNESNALSSRGLIHMLVDIVSRGGNLLLIVSPTGDGALPPVCTFSIGQKMAGCARPSKTKSKKPIRSPTAIKPFP